MQNAETGEQGSRPIEEQTTENIKDFGSMQMKNSKGNIHCLTIVGEIEGHTAVPPSSKATKYEHILPILVSVEQDEEVDGLLVLLNTVGGDVEAGLAIAELISSMTKPTATLVLGGGHSIGVPLAVSGNRSFIASSATAVPSADAHIPFSKQAVMRNTSPSDRDAYISTGIFRTALPSARSLASVVYMLPELLAGFSCDIISLPSLPIKYPSVNPERENAFLRSVISDSVTFI